MKPPIKIQLDNVKKNLIKIPLTDSPRSKEPQKIPLTTSSNYDIEMIDHLWIKNEDNTQDDSEGVSELDSLQGD